jgi:hypothetical protein
LAESLLCAHIVGQHGDRLQELVQKVLQESGWLGNPTSRSAATNPYQGSAHGEVNKPEKKTSILLGTAMLTENYAMQSINVIC